MPTVAISKETRHKLGQLNNGNENLGDTIEKLCEYYIKNQGLEIPQYNMVK